jgi:hypothetical protein
VVKTMRASGAFGTHAQLPALNASPLGCAR